MFIDVDADARRITTRDRLTEWSAGSWTVMLVLPLWLSAFAAFRPLAEPDEGRYTHIARSMTQTGDWLIPRINGLPFLHKPPLYYWLEALVINVFGLHLWSARLPSLAAALMACACVHHLVKRTSGLHAARWSVAVLATSPLFFAGAQFANLDMLVSSLITLTLTLAVTAATSPRHASRQIWVAAYAAAAFGVLTKGLIGVVLPGGVFVVWALSQGKPGYIREAISIPGLALFACIAVPWFLAVDSKFPGFVDYFFVYHHFERYLTRGFNGQYGAWFYPVVAVCGLLPWSAVLFPTWRLKARKTRQARNIAALGIIWFAFVMLFFSLPASKMIGYIFPVLPAFALFAGPLVASWRWRVQALTVAALLCLGLGAFGPHWHKQTAIALADLVADRIAPQDAVVFMDRFSYDVLVRLDRDVPVYVYGDWRAHADEMPDSLRRQLAEGREFEPTSGRVLVGDAKLAELIANRRGSIWIFADKHSSYPQLAGVPIAAEDDTFRIWKGASPRPATDHPPARTEVLR